MADDLVRVAMVILHQGDRVLMQLRDSAPGTYAGGLWGIFGGHMEAGETPEQTAVREIDEELDLRLEGPLALVTHRIDDGRERFVYAVELSAPLEALSLREGAGMALLPRSELDAYPIVPVHREILAAFFEAPRG